MPPSTLREEGERLYQLHREVIEKVIESIGRRERLDHQQADEFRSYVGFRLVEKDYAVLRKFEGKSSISTYLNIVIVHMLLDFRIHLWGRHHPSAEARRLGPVAVLLETIVHRDGRSIEEALPYCQRLDPEITLPRLRELAGRLPARQPKTRMVEIDAVAPRDLSVSPDTVLEKTLEADRTALSRKIGQILRETMAGFPIEARQLMRYVFGAGMTIAEAARTMKKDQKPLYRVYDRCILAFRRRLEESGISGGDAEEIHSGKFSSLDFGLSAETDAARPSLSDDHQGEKEED